MIDTKTLQDRVKAGVKFLDEVRPGWENRINLYDLDINNIDSCVISQLEGGWSYGVRQLGLTAEDTFRLGFEVDTDESGSGDDRLMDVDELTSLWRELILARRS